jgi:hypothetical protein
MSLTSAIARRARPRSPPDYSTQLSKAQSRYLRIHDPNPSSDPAVAGLHRCDVDQTV